MAWPQNVSIPADRPITITLPDMFNTEFASTTWRSVLGVGV
jgi:hypothetical protein